MLANTNLDTTSLIFWSAIALMVLVPVILRVAYKFWKTHRELELKYEMIARGMSVDEIERVLAAGSGHTDAEKCRPTLSETQAYKSGAEQNRGT